MNDGKVLAIFVGVEEINQGLMMMMMMMKMMMMMIFRFL